MGAEAELFSVMLINYFLLHVGSLLLESKIQPGTAYRKQQETLIVWSEGDNFDLALPLPRRFGASKKKPCSCDEI